MQRGDLEAFDVLFDRHRRGLLAYVCRLIPNRQQAEDIVQETFVKLVDYRDRLQPEAGVRGWLFRAARNRAIDCLRRDRRMTSADTLPEPASATAAAPDGAVIHHEDRRAVRRALAQLPADDRDVLALRYYGELTFREIAEALGQPLGTVLWRARKTLKQLRHTLFADQDNT